MANGIANKKGKKPADQNENTLVCVARLAKTREKGLDGAGKEVRGCKEQIQRGEYVTIKLSDKPLEINRGNDDNSRD